MGHTQDVLRLKGLLGGNISILALLQLSDRVSSLYYSAMPMPGLAARSPTMLGLMARHSSPTMGPSFMLFFNNGTFASLPHLVSIRADMIPGFRH